MSGFVYFIGADDLPWVKVGYATNIKRRLKELSCSTPFDLRVEATIPCARNKGDALLHKAMLHQRRKREWFERNFIVDELIEKAAGGCTLEEACEWVAWRIDQFRQRCAELDFKRRAAGWARDAADERLEDWKRAAARDCLEHYGLTQIVHETEGLRSAA